MSKRDEDPESREDAELRERTERDTTRSREMPTWSAPVFVDRWLCRGCRAPVDVTSETVDRFTLFNRMLESRGEERLNPHKVVFCDACRARGQAMQGERNRKHTDALAALIVKLKASRDPANEREPLRRIAELGHPDIPGMLETIKAKRDKAPGSKRAPRGDE